MVSLKLNDSGKAGNLYGLAHTAVYAFDGIGGVDELADRCRERKEGDDPSASDAASFVLRWASV